MKKYDIVYFYKYTKSKELQYSLRSVEAHLPHKSVWIYGDKPDNIEPDHFVDVLQTGFTAWQRTTNMLKDICLNEEITDDFWLFNDDFFILSDVKSIKPIYAGTLQDRIDEIESRHDGATVYTLQLKKAQRVLEADGYDTKNYAVHLPILVNKGKALETIEHYPDVPMFRSLYGNMHDIKGRDIHQDVMVIGPHELPKEGQQFVSTSAETFRNTETGMYIQRLFTKPSRFEVRADG